MPFVKPSLHHRRSITSSSPTPAIVDSLSVEPLPQTIDSSQPALIPNGLPADFVLPSSHTPPAPVSRRRSNPTDGDSDGARKRRRKNPTRPEDITRETPILRAPSSSELSRSCGWDTSASSSASSYDMGVEVPIPKENIMMERILVSEDQRDEIHDAADALVEQKLITSNQGEVLKVVFDNSFDQQELYETWLTDELEAEEDFKLDAKAAQHPNEIDRGTLEDIVRNIKTEALDNVVKVKKEVLEDNIRKIKEEALEDDFYGEDYDDDDYEGEEEYKYSKYEEDNPQSFQIPQRFITLQKAKSILLSVRDGVGKFALRLREGRDKKTDPIRDSLPRRSRTYRATLLRRDANRCVITHIREPLIAAHILPFTIASVSQTHCFWSLLRLMLGPAVSDQLFERYGFRSNPKRQGNTGINSPENGWMLRTDLDEFFSRMQCYLEPVPEDPNKYVFNWLEEPADPPMSSKTHMDEKRQRKPLETGDVIDLTPLGTAQPHNPASKTASAVPLPPSRALITMQAAIHKLAHRFRGRADVFDSVDEWDSDTISSLEDDYDEKKIEEQPETPKGGMAHISDFDPVHFAAANGHIYSSKNNVREWLRDVSPSHLGEDNRLAGLKRTHDGISEPSQSGTERMDVEISAPRKRMRPKRAHAEVDREENCWGAYNCFVQSNPVDRHPRPRKRAKTTHEQVVMTMLPTGGRSNANRHDEAVEAVPETGLLSPVGTRMSEAPLENKLRHSTNSMEGAQRRTQEWEEMYGFTDSDVEVRKRKRVE